MKQKSIFLKMLLDQGAYTPQGALQPARAELESDKIKEQVIVTNHPPVFTRLNRIRRNRQNQSIQIVQEATWKEKEEI